MSHECAENIRGGALSPWRRRHRLTLTYREPARTFAQQTLWVENTTPIEPNLVLDRVLRVFPVGQITPYKTASSAVDH
jgi:hypothetical protein